MKAILSTLILLCACSFSLLAQEEKPKDFTKVVPGLTERQVREVVGFPSRGERFKTVVKGTHDTCTYWVYNNQYTVVFKNHLVDRIETDRSAFLAKIQYWAAPDNPDRVQLIYGK